MPQSWTYFSSDKFKTTALINLAGIMERMDEQILPALYNFIGRSFNATPSQLGTLTLCRALVQALSSPIGGLSGDPEAICMHGCQRASYSIVNRPVTGSCRVGLRITVAACSSVVA